MALLTVLALIYVNGMILVFLCYFAGAIALHPSRGTSENKVLLVASLAWPYVVVAFLFGFIEQYRRP